MLRLGGLKDKGEQRIQYESKIRLCDVTVLSTSETWPIAVTNQKYRR